MRSNDSELQKLRQELHECYERPSYNGVQSQESFCVDVKRAERIAAEIEQIQEEGARIQTEDSLRRAEEHSDD